MSKHDPDRWLSTTPALLNGIAAVAARYNDLVQKYPRYRGVALRIPPDIEPAYKRFVRMARRNMSGDQRFTPSELSAMKDFARWTLQANAVMHGDEPKHVEL